MNELRMYVERLFEGRTLTNEAIELKEEIYGNLVARYDDYCAQGMGETDALTRTMASITGIDELLDGLNDQASEGSATAQYAGEKDGATDAEDTPGTSDTAPAATADADSPADPARTPSDEKDAAKTQRLNRASAADAPTAQCPVPPGATAPSAQPRQGEKIRIALLAIAAFVVVLVVVALFAVILGGVAIIPEREQTVATTMAAGSNDATAENGSDGPGNAAAAGNATPRSTIHMQLEDIRLDDIRQYLDAGIMSNASNLDELLAHLPGSTLNPGVVALDTNDRSITISYRYQDGSVDDEQLESALLFNAAVLMCTTDAPDAVQFNICDAPGTGDGAGAQNGNGAQSGDRALDGSGSQANSRATYLFSRDLLESPNGLSFALTPDRVSTQADLNESFRDPVLENPDLVAMIVNNAYVPQQ